MKSGKESVTLRKTIMASKYCSDPYYSNYCSLVTSELDDEFCSCMPNFCKNGVLQNYTVIVAYKADELSFVPYEEYQPFLMPIDKLLLQCTIKYKEFSDADRNCDNDSYRNIRCRDGYPFLQACYTLHTLIERPDSEAEEVSTQTTETLVLDTVPEEININVKEAELQLSFHHAKNILNPYLYGYYLKKGHTNIFRLTKTVKSLLPPPYETNCRDYLSEWKNRGGRGPTTEKECIEECQRNSSMKRLGCIDQVLKGPTNERVCEMYDPDEKTLKAAHECAIEHCRPACYEITYKAIKDVENFNTIGQCYGMFGEKLNQLAHVIINLDGLQTTTYVYSPKYQNIETFSYVGGYVGMWLGISLVAVFDFLETVVDIVRYPFRRIMRQRARRRRVEHINRVVIIV